MTCKLVSSPKAFATLLRARVSKDVDMSNIAAPAVDPEGLLQDL